MVGKTGQSRLIDLLQNPFGSRMDSLGAVVDILVKLANL
jgi:hypothetical protein